MCSSFAEKCNAHWQRAPLGELLPLKYGKSLAEQARNAGGTHPVFGSSGRVGVHSVALTTGPTLIIGRKGNVGAVHYSAVPCWPIDTVYYVEATAGQNLRYYKCLLDSLNLAKLDRSTAIPGLSRDDYNALEVVVAPPEEQEAIVAEIEKQFSRLDEAVANLKRVKANLKRYKAAVLNAAVEGRLVPTEAELARREGRSYEIGAQLLKRILETRRSQWKGKGKFKEPATPDTTALPDLPEGWVWATIEAISAAIVDCPHSTPIWTTSGRICVRTTEFSPGWLDLGKARFVSEETFKQRIARLQPLPGDILYSREGGILGIACQVPAHAEICLGQRMLLIRPSEFIWAGFVMTWLNASFIMQRVKALTGGSASPHLNVEDIRTFPVPVPPRNEQQQILTEVDRRLSLVRGVEVNANLTRAERLRRAVLTRAFT